MIEVIIWTGLGILVLLALFLVGFASFAIGLAVKEKEAVEAGVGRYVVDKNRKVTFEWAK